MEQAKALNALEPFLALSKAATAPRAAADLVLQATSAPNTFIFTELLAQPEIQALATSADYSPALTVLQIFSYGTWATYTQTPGLPPLNDAQALKLRQLSLLTMARDKDALKYGALMSSLQLQTKSELESLVVSAVYAGLITAKLDPAHGVVRVSSVSPLRDLAPGTVPHLINELHQWYDRCRSALDDLDTEIATIRQTAATRVTEKADWDAKMQRLIEDEKNAADSGGGGTGSSRKLPTGLGPGRRLGFGKRANVGSMADVGDEAMDVDTDDDDANTKKRSSRRKL
ncbi:hypothetical protein PspLS_01439 [Pyricularia sp. CBS 133598]|nr:hypothetical protein PspLS_01439 [Pyricularia sp. CBS 133598]